MADPNENEKPVDDRNEFDRYVEDGRPMGRDLTRDESDWVYRNLK